MTMARNTDVESWTLRAIEGLPVRGEVRVKPLIRGDQMTMLELHYPAGSASLLHAHQHESLCYVVKGKVKVVVGEETYTLGSGDACRHPKGVLHSIEGLEDATILEVKSPVQPLDQFLGTTR